MAHGVSHGESQAWSCSTLAGGQDGRAPFPEPGLPVPPVIWGTRSPHQAAAG